MHGLGVWLAAVGVTMALVSVAPTLPVAMVLMVPIGFFAMSFMITGNTMLQLEAKPQARGRVMALYGVVFLGSTPIGAPLVGWLAEVLGARLMFLAAGSLAVAVAGRGPGEPVRLPRHPRRDDRRARGAPDAHEAATA
jgi:Major Facilitator Superfamily.